MATTPGAFPFRGSVAVVTGASRGIGRAISLAFARAGADIVVAARSTEAAPARLPGTIESVAREVEALGARVLAVRADVTDAQAVTEFVERTAAAFGRADILVNNAAYMHRALVLESRPDQWERVFDVNLRGPLNCCRAFLPSMIEHGTGRIINVSSAAAGMALPGIVSYAASKAALEALTRGLAAEVADNGVAVNALRIDRAVATEGALAVGGNESYDWVTPESIADAALALALRPVSFTGRIVVSSTGEER